MTQKEIEHVQRELLLDIILETSRYRVEEDSDDPFRVEVIDRYKALCNGGKAIEQSVVERGLARQEAAKAVEKKWHPNQVRVKINGKSKWTPKELCVQVPCAHSKNGLKWVLKSEVENDA